MTRDLQLMNFDVISIFLDFKKAFDTIDHSLLLEKLKFYSFSEQAIDLIRNFLDNRYYQVKVEDSLGVENKVSLGVPQGAVLGPLLFIIYMNDLNFLELKSPVIPFADDTSILFICKIISEYNYII